MIQIMIMTINIKGIISATFMEKYNWSLLQVCGYQLDFSLLGVFAQGPASYSPDTHVDKTGSYRQTDTHADKRGSIKSVA